MTIPGSFANGATASRSATPSSRSRALRRRAIRASRSATAAPDATFAACAARAPPGSTLPDVESGLVERILAGDPRAVARALSMVEDGDPGLPELSAELFPHTGDA